MLAPKGANVLSLGQMSRGRRVASEKPFWRVCVRKSGGPLGFSPTNRDVLLYGGALRFQISRGAIT